MENLEIIRAKIKDDAIVLIDKIMRSQHDRVVIALPKNTIIAANADSLKNLKSEADGVNKKLILISNNEKIKIAAKKAGLEIFADQKDLNLPELPVSEASRIISFVPHNNVTRMADIVAPYSADSLNPVPDAIKPNTREPLETEMSHELILGDDIENGNEEQNLPQQDALLKLDDKKDFERSIEEFYGDKLQTQPIGIKTPGLVERLFAPSRLVFLLALLSIAAAGASLFLVLPKASIKLTAKEKQINVTIPVTISKSISSVDTAAGIIPGQVFSAAKDASKTLIPSSASEKDVLTYTRGTIHIYNAYSAAPQMLVSGTRFETKDGKIFRISKAIVIPGAKVSKSQLTPASIEAQVVADKPGPDYNIDPAYFTIPGFKDPGKFAGFYAKSNEKFSGGRIGKSLVVTQNDLDKAASEIQADLMTQLKQEVAGASQNRLKFIDSASEVKIAYIRFSANAGDAVDSFTVEAKIDWRGIAFREEDLKLLISSYLSSKYPDLNSLQVALDYDIVNPEVDWARGELSFVLNIDDSLASIVSVDELKKSIAGKDREDIRKIIASLRPIQSATVTLWPFWASKAPVNLDRIDIIINEGK